MTPDQSVLIVITLILFAAILAAAAIWPMFSDRDDQDEYVAELQHINAERAADFDTWQHDLREWGVVFESRTYPQLAPAALDADAERLAATADLPAVEVAPRLIPLPEPGAIEPTAVLPPGEIAAWVRATLSEGGDNDGTFVRKLRTSPLNEIPALFDQPRALTAGVS